MMIYYMRIRWIKQQFYHINNFQGCIVVFGPMGMFGYPRVLLYPLPSPNFLCEWLFNLTPTLMNFRMRGLCPQLTCIMILLNETCVIPYCSTYTIVLYFSLSVCSFRTWYKNTSTQFHWKSSDAFYWIFNSWYL